MRQRYGQHFLKSPAVLSDILSAVAPQATDSFVEIGPGNGALTDALVESGAQVVGVEIDRTLAAKLTKRYGNKATIINADMLTYDWATLLSGEERLVGNLPYNISAPLLLRMADMAALWRDCYIMVQKEVGQRLCALPGGADYGRLTVRGRWAFVAEWLFEVPPSAFAPPPKVDSAVLRLLPNPSTPPPLADAILRAAFQKRRKTLKNALSDWTIAWDKTGIDDGRRPQTLSPEEFALLAANTQDGDTIKL